MSLRPTVVCFSLSIALAALGLSGTALAGEDAKVYPASVCQQAGRSQSLEYTFGRAINAGNSGVNIDCPVVTDSPYGALYRGRAYARVIDLHYTENVTCVLYEFDTYAQRPTYAWSARSTSGMSYSVQTLTFDQRYAPISWYTFSPSIFGCYLPGNYSGLRSQLVSFQVYEYETSSANSSN